MLFAPEDIDGSEDLGKTADIVLADEEASDRGRGNGGSDEQEGVSARLTLDIVDLDYGDEDELDDEAAEQTEQQKLDQNDVEKAPNVSFWNLPQLLF